MIAVVGSPAARRSPSGTEAAGLAAAIGRAAAERASVQLIGKVGEGSDGDAILVSLARDGIGHVAVLRDLEPVAVIAAEHDDLQRDPFDDAVPSDGDRRATSGPPLDASDLELALRYLPDYDVVVVAQPLDESAAAAVVAAARWAGARLVIVAPIEGPTPDDATVLEPPADDPEGSFATLVGRYAAALDRGADPADAFAEASSGTGWTPVAVD
jgi:hypothetical protein